MKFVLLKPQPGGPVIKSVMCSDDNTFKTIRESVDGCFTLCTHYFRGLPKTIDVWCNDECLYRSDLLPILVYQGEIADGVLKGNLLFTASDQDGNTIGLTDEEISEIFRVIGSMPMVSLKYTNKSYNVLLSR